MRNNIGINFNFKLINKYKQKVCGDNIAYTYIKEENRFIVVLSDGLGSGVKANVLSTMASTMICRYTKDEKDILKVAEKVLKYLPECSERKIKYSTFTILDINSKGELKLIEYGNPFTLIYREKRKLKIDRDVIDIETDTFDTKIYYSTIRLQENDVIITFSDGVAQAGMGNDIYPSGWKEKYVVEYLDEFFNKNSSYCARDITRAITSTAYFLDEYKNRDDISCATIIFRKPKKMIIASGAPKNISDDANMAQYFWSQEEEKVICGGTTAEILLREIGVTKQEQIKDGLIPKKAKELNVSLITEGVITLNNFLEKLIEPSKDFENRVEELFKKVNEYDEFVFLVGQKINQANIVNSSKIDIRQKIIDKIVKVLEEKYIKKTKIIYY